MSANLLYVLLVGVLFATGVSLLLERSLTRVLLGVILLGHGANILILLGGRAGNAPIVGTTTEAEMADPLPQAMILTAIVITLGMTAFLLALAGRALATGAMTQLARGMDDALALEVHRRVAAVTLGTPGLEPLDDPALGDELHAVHEAERRGVVCAFEPEPGMFVDTLDGVLELRRRLGEPEALRVTLDIGHCVCNEPVSEAACVKKVGPLLANVQTWRCADREGLAYVLDHLAELVVKEVHGSGGYGMLIGPAASRRELAEFRAKLTANPHNYIAQPTLALSTVPTFSQAGSSTSAGSSLPPGSAARPALKWALASSGFSLIQVLVSTKPRTMASTTSGCSARKSWRAMTWVTT